MYYKEIFTYGDNLYQSKSFLGEKKRYKYPITHIHVFCFSRNKIVGFKSKSGKLSFMDGGGIEKGESIRTALSRELIEEGQLKLKDFDIIGFDYILNLTDPVKSQTSLKALASVESSGIPINDPDNEYSYIELYDISDVKKIITGKKLSTLFRTMQKCNLFKNIQSIEIKNKTR